MTISGERRKTVTALFADMVGSTSLGESLDPEPLRQLMARYFEQMAGAIRRHGGTVEKFIGDAVMAVFGVPRAHEDDALRAVRAALEMRDALTDLNVEFARDWGVTVEIRVGVNTGEVMAGTSGDDHSLAVGDAVNLAARLEQTAEPGQILIGEQTRALVGDALQADELPPLPVKGKREPVRVWRLLELSAARSRELDPTLVNRAPELDRLEGCFRTVVDGGMSAAITVVGSAGVGKSRLTREFLHRLSGRATVVEGHCVPYGEGVTFWPVSETIRRAVGIGPQTGTDVARGQIAALLDGMADGELVAPRIQALLGLAPATPGLQETFWAVRRVLEHVADRAPLVAVFEDIHWAEPTLLDLLEYLVERVHAVPVLLCFVTRPELLEARPAWLSGNLNANRLSLGPLSAAHTDLLIRQLLRGARLADESQERLAALAEGNPLFVGETVRMLIDVGVVRTAEPGWSVSGGLAKTAIPPTISALLAARLDQLEPEERLVTECAAVAGRIFWWGLVTALAPPEVRPRVAGHLHALTRKEFITPDPSDLPGDDAFRFTHALLRDVTYQEIPKSVRSQLHQQTADWLENRMGQRAGEYDEIIGYHLEQACRVLTELGPTSDAAQALGRQASARLASAAARAFASEDMPGTVSLLSRAVALLPDKDPSRLALLPRLAFALIETGDFRRLAVVIEETSLLADGTGDERAVALAGVLKWWIRLLTDPGRRPAQARDAVRAAISTFEAVGDDYGLATAWSLLGFANNVSARFADAETAWAHAAVHARRAGERRDELDAFTWGLVGSWAGPTPVEVGLARTDQLLDEARGDRKGMSGVLIMRAVLTANLGRFDEARELIAQARSLCREVGLTLWEAGPVAQVAGVVELLADDAAAAETVLQASADQLREMGEAGWLSTALAWLAEAVYLQGRADQAYELAEESEHLAEGGDVFSRVLWRSVRARVLADRGRTAEAEQLAREAVTLADDTDSLALQADARLGLTHVLRSLGRRGPAERTLAEAIDLYQRKGAVAAIARAKAAV
ncbi:MAG: adenylate/guanylate cyclase domain-containing protein [Streptosporangiaceae bacterium]